MRAEPSSARFADLDSQLHDSSKGGLLSIPQPRSNGYVEIEHHTYQKCQSTKDITIIIYNEQQREPTASRGW